MNRNYLVLAALTSVCGMSAAHASDGTISFTGQLTSQTCTIKVNNLSNVGTVTLPTFSIASLATPGATVGATNFTINLSACTGTMATAAAIFEAGSGVDPITHNIINTGTSPGVQLQLLDSNGAVIKAGDTSQTTTTARTTATGTSAVLPYAVQYYANGTVGAGPVAGSVTYSINYQ